MAEGKKGAISTVEEEILDLEKEVESKVAKVEAEAKDLADAVKRGVDNFVASHLRNSPFSQETAAWNHFFAGIGKLVEGVVKEIKGL